MVWRYPWERLLISSLELWPEGDVQHWHRQVVHRQEHASVEKDAVAAVVDAVVVALVVAVVAAVVVAVAAA